MIRINGNQGGGSNGSGKGKAFSGIVTVLAVAYILRWSGTILSFLLLALDLPTGLINLLSFFF